MWIVFDVTVKRMVVERCEKSIATSWEKVLDIGESPPATWNLKYIPKIVNYEPGFL